MTAAPPRIQPEGKTPMIEPLDDARTCENTDREIWRGPDEGCGDYYADSLHITKDGGLGINCGGSVYVKPIREWHRLAGGPIDGLRATPARCEAGSAKALRLLQLSSCFRGDVCSLLPCACAETLAAAIVPPPSEAGRAPSEREALAIVRLRAAVSGEEFEWEIDGGSPFDDAKFLVDAYDRALVALWKIASLVDSEAGEPLDDAIRIANAALSPDPGAVP